MKEINSWQKIIGLLAIGFEKYGSEQELIDAPIKHLFDVYVKINKAIKDGDQTVDDQARAYFKRMEDGMFLILLFHLFWA